MASAVLGKGRGFAAAARSMSRMDTAIDGVQRLGGVRFDQRRVAEYIVRGIKIIVQDELLKSLSRSGVRSRTGLLARAVASADVWIQGGKIRVAMRSGWPAHLYRYASAIDSGAVRTPRGAGLGARAKRTIKTAFLSGRALTKREARRFDRGVLQTHDGRTIKREAFGVGGATVVRPRPYFFISSAGRKKIQDRFRELYEQYVQGALQVPGAGRRAG